MSEIKWNLVDNLTEENKPRAFSMPLASVPPDFQTNGTIDWVQINNIVNKDQFTPEDPLSRDNPVLNIRIMPPAETGIFADDNSFAGTSFSHPSIRLHAICKGTLTFKPAQESMKNSLILATTSLFLVPWLIQEKVKWWERWTEVGCIPQYVIYENVDKEHLRNVLENINVPLDNAPENKVSSTHGLSFPNEVTQNNDNKEDFITQFLSGTEDYYLLAEPGAFIGKVATESGNQNDSEQRLLSLYVQYTGHTSSTPNFMNPRELFHLLFGDDSEEAKQHPLLKKIDEVALNQTLQPESRRMFIRPPLRTHARVVWEAQKETDLHSVNWKNTGSLGPDRLYNDLSSFYNGEYRVDSEGNAINKCNILPCDISLRSGFRTPLFHNKDNHLNYYFVCSQFAKALNMKLGSSSEPESISSPDGKVWARRWDRKLIAISPKSKRAEELKNMIEKEGRCFITLLLGAHMMILKTVDLTKTILWKPDLSQVKSIFITVFEAGSSGGAQADSPYNISDSELILIELHPGKDPDTKTGLEDLNVLDPTMEYPA